MFKLNISKLWAEEAAKAEEGHDISAGNMYGTETATIADLPVVSGDGGSTYKVPYTTILDITPHEKADRLEFAWVYGFQVVVKKGQHKVGDKVIYVPIDSLLPQWLEDRLFPEDSKIKLHHHRVRQIRIRGLASQGMLIGTEEIAEKVNPTYLKLEQDLSLILGITKFEPPIPGFAQVQGKSKQRNKKHDNPLFHQYNGLDNIKWFPSLFKEGDEVVIQEKLHGTNARASILPYVANTFWKKVKKLLGVAPKFEKCYGSNRVEISAATNYKGFYGEDIYGSTFKNVDVFSKLRPGEIVFGEIIGPSIQKNYTYGLDELRFVVFDMKRLGADGKFQWQTPEVVQNFCEERGFEYVPILYQGPYNRELTYSLTKGNSAYNTSQKVREGVVIKAAEEYDRDGNKRALKWVSEDYLNDGSNTDFH